TKFMFHILILFLFNQTFQGNKVKLQLADYQLAAIFFCLICTTESENSPQNSSSFTPIQRQKLISQFLTPYHLRNSEQREAEVSCRCCGDISHDHS
ncbi:hypothetical protein, partial [uncultured Duncaniella sp.]|uniref:hypothetical protein n=1 Tax=uncultured Duncaniella sp. TaxID=2768039 RepID=UPI0026766E5E